MSLRSDTIIFFFLRKGQRNKCKKIKRIIDLWWLSLKAVSDEWSIVTQSTASCGVSCCHGALSFLMVAIQNLTHAGTISHACSGCIRKPCRQTKHANVISIHTLVLLLTWNESMLQFQYLIAWSSVTTVIKPHVPATNCTLYILLVVVIVEGTTSLCGKYY